LLLSFLFFLVHFRCCGWLAVSVWLGGSVRASLPIPSGQDKNRREGSGSLEIFSRPAVIREPVYIHTRRSRKQESSCCGWVGRLKRSRASANSPRTNEPARTRETTARMELLVCAASLDHCLLPVARRLTLPGIAADDGNDGIGEGLHPRTGWQINRVAGWMDGVGHRVRWSVQNSRCRSKGSNPSRRCPSTMALGDLRVLD